MELLQGRALKIVFSIIELSKTEFEDLSYDQNLLVELLIPKHIGHRHIKTEGFSAILLNICFFF